MSTRTKVYTANHEAHVALHHSTTVNNTVIRWQLKIIPAEDNGLLRTEVTFPLLPDGTVLAISRGSGKFSGWPVGMPDAEEVTIQLDYRLLPSDLREWITTASGVSVTVGDAQFWLSSTWVLTSDRGNSSLDPEDFFAEFIGVHYHQNDADFTFKGENPLGPVTMEVRLRHIGMAVLESLTIEQLRTVILDGTSVYIPTGTVGNVNSFSKVVPRLYQLLVDEGSAVYAYAEDSPVSAHRAWLLELQELMESIVDLATIVLARFLRTQADTDYWGGAGCAWGTGGRPFETTTTFYKQLYDGTRGAGAELSYSELRVVGFISKDASPSDVSSTSATWIGGLLGGSIGADGPVGRGSDTLFELDNLWNLVRALALNAGAKLFMELAYSVDTGPGFPFQSFELTLTCAPICGNGEWGEYPTVTIAPSDLLPDWHWHPGEKAARGGVVSIPDATDFAGQSIEVTTGENFANETVEFNCLVHNLPILRNNPYTQSQAGSGFNQPVLDGNGDLTTPNMIGLVTPRGFSTRSLYYVEQPSGIATTQIGIRVSSNCAVQYSGGSLGSPGVGNVTIDMSGEPDYYLLPYTTTYANQTGGYYDFLFVRWVAAMLQERKRYNMLVALCTAAKKLFARNHPSSGGYASGDGNPHGPAVLSGTLIGHWPLAFIGHRVYLSDASVDGFSSDAMDVNLWDVTPSQREMIVLSLQPDHVNGTAKVDLLATYDDAFWDMP